MFLKIKMARHKFKNFLGSKKFFFPIIFLITISILLRLQFLLTKAGDLFLPNLGGDPCHHYNIAYNLSKGIGPKTNFIFSYWFLHPSLPALTDIYAPGLHFFSAFFLIFNDSYFTARIVVFLLSIFNIFLAYLIGKKVHSQNAGFIAAFIIVFNLHHIENSTIFMRDNFNLLIMQLFFYNFLFLNKIRSFLLIGLITGYASITLGGWQILIIIIIINFFFSINKNKFFFNLYSTIFFLVGFFAIFSVWAFVTKQYFGTVYYSNFNFFPIVKNWREMNYFREVPNLKNFILELDIYNYFYKIIISGFYNIYRISISLTPRFILPIFFLLIPIFIYGVIKLKYIGKIFLLFTTLLYFMLILGAYGMDGKLANRHFIIFLSCISVMLAVGFIEIYNILKKRFAIIKKLNFFFVNKYIISIIFYLGTCILIEKNIGWNANVLPMYNFGDRISKITSKNDIIMYGFTPQDAWCATKRNIVIDPIFDPFKSNYIFDKTKRLKEEINFYNVSYLWIDLSDSIYKRGTRTISEVLKDYKSLKLELVLQDKINHQYFYRIK
jgi:4-amino-4-deoxy-L-arabinose transferase-like glycosyltransferase